MRNNNGTYSLQLTFQANSEISLQMNVSRKVKYTVDRLIQELREREKRGNKERKQGDEGE